jgi:threonylcarbamoyladenosine tRNA methylthiotransferase MtaB
VGTYFVQNFGCRATQADGNAIERQLSDKGLKATASAKDAAVVVLNTCTVTASADQDARAAIRRIHRENPETKILVTGCYAQRAPQEISTLPGVTWVVGNSHRSDVANVVAGSQLNFVPLDNLAASAPTLIGDIFAHTELRPAAVFESGAESGSRTRPNLKVHDGCNNRCSFCIIPYTRGQSRSLHLGEAIREMNALVAEGYREVVISGINLGRWGRDLRPQLRFVDLVRAILAQTELERLRISSVEPMDWSDELIELVATSPRIAKHAHVPLQSGSDATLRRMHRKYRPWHYADRIQKIRTAMPTAAIGADVMVGFPGETDELFEESRAFIAALPFTYLHVFTYSSRPGTPSAAMADQVPVQIARQRNRVLRELAAEKNLRFRESFLGRTLPAITLQRESSGATEALTENYLKLSLAGTHAPNRWVEARIEGLSETGLLGRLMQ